MTPHGVEPLLFIRICLTNLREFVEMAKGRARMRTKETKKGTEDANREVVEV